MKKHNCFRTTISILLILFLTLFVYSCADFYYNKRPQDNTNEKWVCDTPKGYFGWMTMQRDDWPQEKEAFWGEVTIREITYPVQVLFDMGTAAEFYWLDKLEIRQTNQSEYSFILSNEAKLFCADCNFSRNKIIMRINKNRGGILADQIDELIFYRVEIGEDSLANMIEN